ncbi:MAG: ABC transporter ATP-binding protein [Pirellulaceae bacterium]|nr:ABC transporter ATP-binding protein [Pirellulaceae bacterium]
MLLSVEELGVRFHRPCETSLSLSFRRISRIVSSKPPDSPWVLQQFNLHVEANEFLVVLGPSGSGKTTLLRTIAGLEVPCCGRIFHRGTDITKLPPHRRDVSLVFQNGGWYEHLTIQQHFQFEGIAQSRIRSAMERLGLYELRHHRPSELSGGQAQRLAIGRALIRDRSILMLDEPLSQLDQSIRESIRELLLSLHQEGRTIIYVTHDQQDAMLLATKIAVLDRGRIQQIGTPRELIELPNHRRVAEMLGQPSMQFFDLDLPQCDMSRLTTVLQSHASPDREVTQTILKKAFESALNDRVPSKKCSMQVGIRPDAWKVEALPSSVDNLSASIALSLEGQLNSKRYMGPQDLTQWTIGETSLPKINVLCSRSSNIPNLVLGNRYRLSVEFHDLHFFETETGDRISFEAEASEPR